MGRRSCFFIMWVGQQSGVGFLKLCVVSSHYNAACKPSCESFFSMASNFGQNWWKLYGGLDPADIPVKCNRRKGFKGNNNIPFHCHLAWIPLCCAVLSKQTNMEAQNWICLGGLWEFTCSIVSKHLVVCLLETSGIDCFYPSVMGGKVCFCIHTFCPFQYRHIIEVWYLLERI